MNNKEQEIQEFKSYLVLEAKANNKDPKQYVLELSKDENKLKEAYSRFQAHKKKKAQKAAHGAKLNYFKSLKHQCAEDEELVYYKRGGSVDCGCVKKKGGEIEKAEEGTIAKFKNKVKNTAKKVITGMSKAGQDIMRRESKPEPPKSNKKDIYFQGRKQYIIGKDIQEGSGNDTSEQEKKDKSAKDYYSGTAYHKKYTKGGEVKKDCGGSKMKIIKKGGTPCPKCGKVHSGNCTTAKFKAHKNGGNIKINFYQKGGGG